jgi:predicted CoA-binding protein
LQNGRRAYPINLIEKIIEGVESVETVLDLPDEVESLSIITPPPFTERIVEQAIAKGIKHIWMQPGAESELAIANAKAHNMTVIAHGPCVLVQLGFREDS